jgi:hypothetical protein
MTARVCLLALPLAGAFLYAALVPAPVPACCPVPPQGKPVVNADQTVILLWDAATKTEHFIRRASFQSEADDFGFLVPTPNQPTLAESGNEAFPFLQKLTEPEIQKRPKPSGGCGGCPAKGPLGESGVRVLDEKTVAGFKAVVLEAASAGALVKWLADNGYAFSPEVKAWARPYVEAGWKITALKVAKDKDATPSPRVAASALRLSFRTERPLFPYREPEYKHLAEGAEGKQPGGAWLPNKRLLRIYFLSEARYRGELTRDVPWTGKVAWSGKLRGEDRQKVLKLLQLPEATGPAEWWLTEFEDDWRYQVAPADVYFSRDADQGTVKRPPIVKYVSAPWPTDLMTYALAAALVLPPLLRRVGRR